MPADEGGVCVALPATAAEAEAKAEDKLRRRQQQDTRRLAQKKKKLSPAQKIQQRQQARAGAAPAVKRKADTDVPGFYTTKSFRMCATGLRQKYL